HPGRKMQQIRVHNSKQKGFLFIIIASSYEYYNISFCTKSLLGKTKILEYIDKIIQKNVK
ncbi:MAG: hypothetical protein K1W08_01510, partial [Lachnospiraceae bacterium]